MLLPNVHVLASSYYFLCNFYSNATRTTMLCEYLAFSHWDSPITMPDDLRITSRWCKFFWKKFDRTPCSVSRVLFRLKCLWSTWTSAWLTVIILECLRDCLTSFVKYNIILETWRWHFVPFICSFVSSFSWINILLLNLIAEGSFQPYHRSRSLYTILQAILVIAQMQSVNFRNSLLYFCPFKFFFAFYKNWI